LAFSAGSYTPITVHDDPQWWMAQQATPGSGGLTSAYYSPDLPNGSLYFATTPGGAYAALLLTRWMFGAVLQTASLVLAPGYKTALQLTVMEAVADAFHATLTDKQIQRAGKARARIFGNNLRVPILSAAGLGLPGTSGARWDYRTGTWK
jgi:hypothetical protein